MTPPTLAPGDVPAAARDWELTDAAYPDIDGPATRVVNDIWTALLDFLDDRRELPTYVRSKHVAPACDYTRSQVGRTLDVFVRADDCPLDVTVWNESPSSNPTIWRIARGDGDE